jgi:hypothetical protein
MFKFKVGDRVMLLKSFKMREGVIRKGNIGIVTNTGYLDYGPEVVVFVKFKIGEIYLFSERYLRKI